ncbi:uncharacterized protein LOC118736254 [Rhagoletis pomonella]|uniref:uncharacterized protein LOC118736254 n=1 Tax=Rhagoletis pomonella TaxID=28610 RepID=UPI0017845E9C|nr:uncharacterized protein LOC118736254 [Rhagoletis pomonella]
MHSFAFRLVAEEEEERLMAQKVERRKLHDAINPFELPQSLFEKYYRLNKPGFQYLLDVLTANTEAPKKAFAISPIAKLSGCLRFLAEGGYQTGVGKDCDVSLAQSSFSKVLTEVLTVFGRHLCPQWIKVSESEEENRNIARAFYIKHDIPGVMGCIDGTL